jgi:hypothetical protein
MQTIRTVLALGLLACSLGACSVDEPTAATGAGHRPPSDAGAGTDAPRGSPGDATACIAVLLFDPAVHRIVRGGHLSLHASIVPPLDEWQISIDDPTIARMTVQTFQLELDALTAGTTTIRATHCDRTVSFELTVVPAAAIEVRVAQGNASRPAPAPHVTALTGTTDFLEITYLDAAGGVLAGTGALTYAGEGVTVLSTSSEITQSIVTDGIPREYPLLGFGSGGRLVATGDFGAAPIDIAVTPRPDHIAVGLNLFFDVLHTATITGQTAAGEPIAGVRATWTVTPTDNVLVYNPSPELPAHEIYILPETGFHGAVTITGHVDPQAATATFNVP